MPLIAESRTEAERDEFLLYLLEWYDRVEGEDTVEDLAEKQGD
jgi:hypothetical protein